MAHIAATETAKALDRLARMIERDERSMRRICEETKRLDVPERMHHSTLSNIFHLHDGRNMYLRQFFVLLKILNTTPLAFFAGGTRMAAVVDGLNHLPATDRQEIIQELIDQLARDPKNHRRIERIERSE